MPDPETPEPPKAPTAKTAPDPKAIYVTPAEKSLLDAMDDLNKMLKVQCDSMVQMAEAFGRMSETLNQLTKTVTQLQNDRYLTQEEAGEFLACQKRKVGRYVVTRSMYRYGDIQDYVRGLRHMTAEEADAAESKHRDKKRERRAWRKYREALRQEAPEQTA